MCTLQTAASISGRKEGFKSGVLSGFSRNISWSSERSYYLRHFSCLYGYSVTAVVKYATAKYIGAVATRISLQTGHVVAYCFFFQLISVLLK